MSKPYRMSDFLARRADAAQKAAKDAARAERLPEPEPTSSGPWQPREPMLPDDRDFGPAMARLTSKKVAALGPPVALGILLSTGNTHADRTVSSHIEAENFA